MDQFNKLILTWLIHQLIHSSGVFSVVSGCGVIAQWSQHWCTNQSPWVRSPVALSEFFPFLRPNVSAFFLSTGVLGMDYFIDPFV